jgi:type IV pilus assembly protein PilC
MEFRYKALSSSGETIQGIRQSASAAALAQELAAQDLILLHSRRLSNLLNFAGRKGKSVKPKELRDFTLHMATCFGAGIPIIQSLRDIEDGMAGSPFQEVIADIRKEVSNGSTLAKALSHQGEAFPDLYITIIDAGERSGSLDRSFVELLDYLEWLGELKGKVKQALIYPTILVVGVVGLFLLMLLFVLPRFLGVFEDMDFELPTLTARVLAFSHWLRFAWPFLAGGIFLVVAGFKYARRRPDGRFWLDSMALRIPVVGGFVANLALSRFARNFAMLFGAGIDILGVLGMLQNVVGNAVLSKEIGEIRSKVVGGQTLSSAFEDSEWFPPLVKRLIGVGENAGNLDVTLAKAGEYMDQELPRALKKFFTIMDAVIIAVLGVLIAVAALSMLLPIFSIQGALH